MLFSVPILASIAIGSFGCGILTTTEDCLRARGLSAKQADFPQAIEVAFASSDRDLLLCLHETLRDTSCAEKYSDQILALYEAHPDDDFKKAIGLTVAYELSLVRRIAQSRWSCVFHDLCVPILMDTKCNGDRLDASWCLRGLSRACGFRLNPYLLKALLCLPEADNYIGGTFFRDLNMASITPTEAYYIYKRYNGRYGYADDVKPFAKLAEAYLSPAEKAPEMSREDLLKKLGDEIAAIGKKLHEDYGNKEVVPLPLPDPNRPLERFP